MCDLDRNAPLVIMPNRHYIMPVRHNRKQEQFLMTDKIRPIVRDAFKVDELVHQFEDIDIADGYLKTASIEEVNEKYDDAYLISEARHRLDIAMDPINQEEADWRRDAKQLRRFIKKWGQGDD